MSVNFSPDGKTIVSSSGNGYRDNVVRVWDAHTGKLIRTLTGHTRRVKTVRFSPDGKMIVSGSHDGTILLWDARF